jgi:hypothetical protein
MLLLMMYESDDEEIDYQYNSQYKYKKSVTKTLVSDFNINKFYYNMFKNDKQFFSNHCSDSTQHQIFVNKINQAFFYVLDNNWKPNPIIYSINEQWKKYGNISEKQLLVLKKNSILEINLNDCYSYYQFKELSNKWEKEKDYKEWIEKIKETLTYKHLSKDCLSIIMKYV